MSLHGSNTTRTCNRSLLRVVAPATLIVVCMQTAVAADWPRFKAGEWTFERVMSGTGATPEQVTSTECTDPTTEQKKQRDMLTRAGCQFTPLERSGKTYRYSATCALGGITTQSDSVLEVASAEAYTITVDSTVNGSKTHEVLQARRVGDCRK